MKEISEEIINVNGIDYKLFLNRQGMVAWEKFNKNENEQLSKMQDKYKDLLNNEDVEIKEDTNPFENLENLEEYDKDQEIVTKSYKKLYWIMLYTNHKMNINEVDKWYEDACKDYGEAQLIQLAQQMIEDANKNKIGDLKEIKNLPALRPRN